MRNLLSMAACLLAALVLTSCSGTDDVIDPGGPAGADPPCSDGSGNRFVDCGNGTVTDTDTGLIWLKDANCFGNQDWGSSEASTAGLADGQCGLTDNSSAGNWRLPTLRCLSGSGCDVAGTTGELASIFAPSCPAPQVPDTAGTGCWSEGNPFSGLRSYLWSSTKSQYNGGYWWFVNLDNGYVSGAHGGSSLGMWPVRGGP